MLKACDFCPIYIKQNQKLPREKIVWVSVTSWAWRCVPLIPMLRKERQMEVCEFEASLLNIEFQVGQNNVVREHVSKQNKTANKQTTTKTLPLPPWASVTSSAAFLRTTLDTKWSRVLTSVPLGCSQGVILMNFSKMCQSLLAEQLCWPVSDSRRLFFPFQVETKMMKVKEHWTNTYLYKDVTPQDRKPIEINKGTMEPPINL